MHRQSLQIDTFRKFDFFYYLLIMKLLTTTLFVLFIGNVAFCSTYYLDPVNGSMDNDGSFSSPWTTLSEIINANYIQSQAYTSLPYTVDSQLIEKNVNGFVEAGDTLVLHEGLHGVVFLRNYINEHCISVQNYPGEIAILERVQLQACKNWSFEGVHVSTEPYGYYLNNRLFHVETHGWHGPSSHITIQNCQIYSTTEPWTTAQDWLDYVSSGLYVHGDSCLIRKNQIYNIDMGLTCRGDDIIAEQNEILNFSGDGGRILGSRISFNYNLIKNNYNVDDNHDDGIQSFTNNGYVVDDNEVIGNLIINSDDENQPLGGPLQGIACFDGFFNDWTIANNVISVNHWHGITLLGARRCTIIHNTVIDPTPNVTPGGSWIRIDDHKDGTPSSDCVVANNVANQFNVDGQEISNRVLDDLISYQENFIDFENFDFNLTSNSILISSANLDFSVSKDFYLNDRDSSPDIGAVEYIDEISSVSNYQNSDEFVVSPNPFTDDLVIANLEEHDQILVFDIKGAKLLSGNITSVNSQIKYLSSGRYNIVIVRDDNIIASSIVYKID